MEFKKVKLDELKEYPDNPRVGDVRRIADSLMKNGQYRPLTVNKKDNVILTGNHTYQAMQKIGWEECLVTYVDVDEDKAKKIVLVDNRLNDLAEYDQELLNKMLKELVEDNDFFGTGYDSNEVEDVLKSVDIDFSVPEVEEENETVSLTKQPETVKEILLYFNDSEFEEYKNNIIAIADFHKCNLQEATLWAIDNTYKKLGLK
tara:strand:+ start:1976 stop:2584 length:609 start_codon:yes stop_codon:yes gene_type:complete